jgi:hypothetical protein
MSVQRDPKTDEITAIVCDEIGCMTKAPDDDTLIMKHHGLRGLGWYCSGGKHLCPVHAP